MKAFKIDTEGNAFVKDIIGDLHSLQEEVGGLITLAPYYEELENQNIDIFADDEGLLKANPTTTLIVVDNNKKITARLVGNLIFVSHNNDGETIGLTEEQIKFIKNHIQTAIISTPSEGIITVYTFAFHNKDGDSQ